MSTEEFLSKYGWWKSIYYNPSKRERRWDGEYRKDTGKRREQDWVLCECSICHEEDWVRWSPTIVYATVKSRSYGMLGHYICKDCVDWSKAQSKRAQTLGKEELHRIGKQGYNTRLEKYGGPRNPVERLIDEEFGSVHVRIVDKLPGFDVRPEREIDNYFPDLKIGINIDEWSGHSESSNSEWKKSRPQGEHKYVDDYFKSNFGITIYHIPEHYKGELLNDWALGLLQERIKSILDGSYDGPTIDVEDPVYGDIKYA